MVPLLRHELGVGAGAARHLPAPAGDELDVVDEEPRRDLLERKRVSRMDVGFGPREERVADLYPVRRDDVALLAVAVGQQRDERRPVRIVLERAHGRRDADLVPLEIDDAVHPLVAAADVPARDVAVVVAAARLADRLEERLLWRLLREHRVIDDGLVPLPRRYRLELLDSHRSVPLCVAPLARHPRHAPRGAGGERRTTPGRISLCSAPRRASRSRVCGRAACRETGRPS